MASQPVQLTAFALSAVSPASSAKAMDSSADFRASPRLVVASSDLLFAELMSRSISGTFFSALSASLLDLLIISLNFWGVQ